jgi:hypothetical protein
MLSSVTRRARTPCPALMWLLEPKIDAPAPGTGRTTREPPYGLLFLPCLAALVNDPVCDKH